MPDSTGPSSRWGVPCEPGSPAGAPSSGPPWKSSVRNPSEGSSAGTGAGHGRAATEEAEVAVKAYGADLSRHASQPVSLAMVEEADRVFVMTPRHKRALEEYMPEHAAKIELLDPKGRAVEDPVGGSAEVYRESARHIREALVERLKEIA